MYIYIFNNYSPKAKKTLVNGEVNIRHYLLRLSGYLRIYSTGLLWITTRHRGAVWFDQSKVQESLGVPDGKRNKECIPKEPSDANSNI